MKVFVYGTLMRGMFNSLNFSPPVSLGSTEGSMYVVKTDNNPFVYPAVIHGSGTIRGEVYDVEPITVQYLDFIEGYEEYLPAESLFIRELVKVKLDEGDEIEAYVYFYNMSVDNLKPIEHGDWRKYVEPKV
jgi:gamma-glutamylcyclotransferase (GGCT)/AIG2-like uncharacterized protein YtfP